MFFLGIRDLVRLMLSLAGPIELVQGVSWPLHQALREAADEAVTRGVRGFPHVEFRPDPDAGRRADDADAAVQELRWNHVLLPTGSGMAARLVSEQFSDPAVRRTLLRLPPETADIVYRAARRWAALAATSSKNWATESASSGATVASAMPALRHVSTSALR